MFLFRWKRIWSQKLCFLYKICWITYFNMGPYDLIKTSNSITTIWVALNCSTIICMTNSRYFSQFSHKQNVKNSSSECVTTILETSCNIWKMLRVI